MPDNSKDSDAVVDPDVNPQAQRPGLVEPQRTPGSAPSVVPLPDGADPDAPIGAHPLPEEAIEGYPAVAEQYEDEQERDEKLKAARLAGNPYPTDADIADVSDEPSPAEVADSQKAEESAPAPKASTSKSTNK